MFYAYDNNFNYKVSYPLSAFALKFINFADVASLMSLLCDGDPDSACARLFDACMAIFSSTNQNSFANVLSRAAAEAALQENDMIYNIIYKICGV